MKNNTLKCILSLMSVTTVFAAGTHNVQATKYRAEKSIVYFAANGFDILRDEKLRGDIESPGEVIGSAETIDDIQTQSIIDEHVHDATKSHRNREVKPFNPPPQYQGINGTMNSFWKLLGY